MLKAFKCDRTIFYREGFGCDGIGRFQLSSGTNGDVPMFVQSTNYQGSFATNQAKLNGFSEIRVPSTEALTSPRNLMM